jgi:hypothetical protein
VVEVPADKASLVLNGTFGYLWHTMDKIDYLNGVATDWSNSAYLTVAPGDMENFETQVPEALFPLDKEIMESPGRLRWRGVPGADAYLVCVRSELGDEAITVTRDTQIKPPFPGHCEYIEGVKGLQRFQSGWEYSWCVCALRVKSGALGFVIDCPDGGHLPQIFSRYEHPSGIILQSQWSEKSKFSIE